MIPFNIPVIVGTEKTYIDQVFLKKKFSGKGSFTQEAQNLIGKILETTDSKILYTTSCTDALEMCALLMGIGPGDEVIMPSFTFVSTANAFVLRGAKIIFVDVEPQSLNIDVKCVESAITSKTKAVVCVHYAGMSTDMKKLRELCDKRNVYLIEDAAQALSSTYDGKKLGTWGDVSAFSFHDTKNYHSGEGGALVVNNPNFIERAEILIEKGTDRSKFVMGLVDKYTWQDVGSSFLGSDLNAAFLKAQLEQIDVINKKRLGLWARYEKGLAPIFSKDGRSYVKPIDKCVHNAHLFGLIFKSIDERNKMMSVLKDAGIQAVPHYIPLHSSPAGLRFSEFRGVDKYTTDLSYRLLRLPLFYDLTEEEVDKIVNTIAKNI